MSQEGRKHDTGKARYDLIPVEALLQIAKVLTFGAAKYEDENWRQVKDGQRRYYAALMRHLEAYRSGQWLAPDSKLPHLAHVATNAIFLLYFGRVKRVRHGKR